MEIRTGVRTLTERQQRELEYHKHHATLHAQEMQRPSFDAIYSSQRRWWNAYWEMYRHIRQLDLRGKKALVVGCGFGLDAMSLALLGADVCAFDLSIDELQVATQTAAEGGLTIEFQQMAAEALTYGDHVFDLVLVVDILHHCEIDKCMREIARVAKSGSQIIINELYTHTLLDRVRNSYLVSKILYPRLVRLVYEGQMPYITQDERKLTEQDLRQVLRTIAPTQIDYYDIVAKRLFPDSITALAKLDRVAAILLRPIGWLVAGRVIVIGRLATG